MSLHPLVPSWEGVDNNGRTWILICTPPNAGCLDFQLSAGGYAVQVHPTTCTCNPFDLVFNVILAALPFCSGTATLTITA